MASFIRMFDNKSQTEVNINTAHIASFLPTEDKGGSVIRMANGMSHTVNESNRSVRHAIKKNSEILTDPSNSNG